MTEYISFDFLDEHNSMAISSLNNCKSIALDRLNKGIENDFDSDELDFFRNRVDIYNRLVPLVDERNSLFSSSDFKEIIHSIKTNRAWIYLELMDCVNSFESATRQEHFQRLVNKYDSFINILTENI